MPFAVYVLRSRRNGRHYVGFTSRSVGERVDEHNRGYPKGWTSRNGPFELVYDESHGSESEARARERFLKSGRGREWLTARLAAYPPEAGGDFRRRRTGASPWSGVQIPPLPPDIEVSRQRTRLRREGAFAAGEQAPALGRGFKSLRCHQPQMLLVASPSGSTRYRASIGKTWTSKRLNGRRSTSAF